MSPSWVGHVESSALCNMPHYSQPISCDGLKTSVYSIAESSDLREALGGWTINK